MGSGAGVVVVEGLLRRIVLPLTLIAAVVFRYNVLSLVYLLMFIVFLMLPGTLLKTNKASNVVFLSVLLVFSAVAALGQALFQTVLATHYSEELYPCHQKENIWRQFGFILYSVPGADGVYGVDVVAHLLPDVVVFATALVTLIFSVVLVAGLMKDAKEGQTNTVRRIKEETPTPEGEAKYATASSEQTARDVKSELSQVTSGVQLEPPFPPNMQCYYRLPHIAVLVCDASIFVTLGLAGVALPSLTSFVYYVMFFTLVFVWSLHLKLKGIVRVVRCALFFYSAIHLIVLYLYQFQVAQDRIPLHPGGTSQSLLARLFGLSAIILTDCKRPTELLLHPNLEYTAFINPLLILILMWILATDLRLWLGTPKSLWKEQYDYYIPVGDSLPSSNVVCLIKRDGHLEPGVWTQYGTYKISGREAEAYGANRDSDGDGRDADYIEYREHAVGDAMRPEIRIGRRRKVTWEDIKQKIVNTEMILWDLLLHTSYILAIICMMLWSVVYPSWPALLLLIWACAIWLIPKVTPQKSLYYTSPVLILYAIGLLLLQYMYSLNLTTDELAPQDGLGEECEVKECSISSSSSGSNSAITPSSDECNPTPGCRSFVLLIKSVFTIVFFAAFHEFVKMKKGKYGMKNMNSNYTDEQLDDRNDSPTVVNILRDKLYAAAMPICCNYWVLLVIAAFLLVTFTGEPNLLKIIYLIFFFVFILTYQITSRWWYYACVPVWWGLVLYAAFELVLIYTYQFDSISDIWERAYNATPHLTVDSKDLFNSIGLRKYGINSLRSLIISLIPPAIFIAVMAMQLRYFKPTWIGTTAIETSPISVDLSKLLPSALRLSVTQPVVHSRDSVIAVDVTAEEKEEEIKEEGRHSQRPLSRSSSVASSVAPGSPLYHCSRVTMYILLKTKQTIVELGHTFWRFLELHVHKIAMFVLFAVALFEISAGYWLLLILSLLATALPFLIPVFYPLLTFYLGLLTILKTIYQLPIIQTGKFNLTNDSNETCYWTPNITHIKGQVFSYQYSSRDGDGAWFGLHKTDNYATYIAGPIFSVLLLSLWYSAKRHQAYFYRSRNIAIDTRDSGSLFLGISQQKAEKSIWMACKYYINHIYDLYGTEITFIMLAIAVTIRIDVYGMLYCAILGLLLLVPRRILAPLWLFLMFVQGLLLLFQYAMLLGVPPGVCFSKNADKGYPWDTIGGNEYTTNVKKWLFLPDYPQILNKNVIYADFLVYLLMCLQLYNFRSVTSANAKLANFLQTESLINGLKVFMTQYFFWVSLFLIFFSAISHVSVFGIFYLLVCFVFLYRGQSMLMDRRIGRKKSWTTFRLLAWGILFIRVSVQIVECVFYSRIGDTERCILIVFLNGACNRMKFYGSSYPSCKSPPGNVGLWVDALAFAVITVQIIIFDTQYSEMLREYLIKRQQNSGYFSDVFDIKMEEKHQKAKESGDRELIELKERAERLSVTENQIDHILYAGVIIPSDIHLRLHNRSAELDDKRDEDMNLTDYVLSSSTEEPKSKARAGDEEENQGMLKQEVGKFEKIRAFIYKTVTEFVDVIIEKLEASSALYIEVVEELKQQEEEAEKEKVEDSGYVRDEIAEGDFALYHRNQEIEVEVHIEEENLGSNKVGTQSEHDVMTADIQTPQLLPSTSPEQLTETTPLTRKNVHFDEANDVIYGSSTEQYEHIAQFEKDIGEVAIKYSQRGIRLLRALKNTALAHAEYIIYFLVILNVILNGSLLSLGYACLLFGWGLFSIPLPSKRYWLVMIFYTMVVLIVKYVFQLHDINDNLKGDPERGLFLPRILGIEHFKNFFNNAVWDMLLLIALLFNRGLLKQSGHWRDYRRQTNGVMTGLWNDVKRFFSRLIDPDISQGASDYYVTMLFFDTLCLLTIVFGVSSFGLGVAGQGAGQAAQFIQNNFIPISFVIMLLLQFLSMLVDRAIYLRHALKTKIAYQIILLVVWHFWLLFFLPSDLITMRPFTSNTAAQCIYFFKSLYFIVSAMQIVSGYPTHVLGYFLGQKYTTVSGLLFSGYRAIPLLPELREVMDWVFTDTALPLLHWLRVQEIYAKLYLVKVRRMREKGSPRDLGEKQSLVVKVLLGGLLLTVLVLLIWGPLLVISLVNSTSTPNPPISASVSLAVEGYEPLVQIRISRESLFRLTRSEYISLQYGLKAEVRQAFGNQYLNSEFTRAVFPNESTALWIISPPARQSLLDTLYQVKNNRTLSFALRFSWTLVREPASNSVAEDVSGASSRLVTYATDPNAINALIFNLEKHNASNRSIVMLQNLYPRLIFAPTTGSSRNYTELSSVFTSSANISCSTNLSSLSKTNQEWWTLYQCTNPINPSNVSGPELLIYSSPTAVALFSFIAGFGIIGLYVSVVLVISKLIRGYISSLPSELLLDEIVNPNPLLELCKDIFTVREGKDFKLEEILVGKLFSILRSPSKLTQLTEGTKQKQD